MYTNLHTYKKAEGLWFKFPTFGYVCRDAPAGFKPPAVKLPNDMGNVFILVAEDDADDRFLIQTAFDEKGYKDRIQFVENGVELLRFLDSMEERLEEGEFPGFILLDLNMPKKDGREVLKELKQHHLYKRIPVVIFTTTNNEAEIKRCYELGANTYVVKPANFDMLLSVLSDIRNYWLQTASIPH